MLKFISNNATQIHSDAINSLFDEATRIDFLIAFATKNGFSEIEENLNKFLQANGSARIIVGLDFYHTEPEVLLKLLRLSKNYPEFKFFISKENSAEVFHPKAYAFYKDNIYCHVIIGSANLTAGGMYSNYEFSTLVKVDLQNNGENEFLNDFNQNIEDMISDNVNIVTATKEIINDYTEERYWQKIHQKIGSRRAHFRLPPFSGDQYDILRAMLKKMRQDYELHAPQNEFDFSMKRRDYSRGQALDELKRIINTRPQTAEDFLEIYRRLVTNPRNYIALGLPEEHYFHSGLLQIHMKTVSKYYHNFTIGISNLDAALAVNPNLPPADAYNLLSASFNKNKSTGYTGVSGASTNVVTEILHAYNNESYAVMNSNSVNALVVSGVNNFPESPGLDNTDGKLYEEFCNEAKKACKALGLSNFTEFDAVGNYVYWD